MTREEILEKRRVMFTGWAIRAGFDIFLTQDMEYLDERTRDIWRAWNAALDSVEIELPPALVEPAVSMKDRMFEVGYNQAISDSNERIKSQGYRVKL